MRNSIKKWVCIALAMLVLAGSTVYAVPQPKEEREIYQKNDFIYEVLQNQTLSIHFYTGDDLMVEVPRSIDGMPVRKIESYAFYGTQVKDVIIAEGVTDIGAESFYNCALESLQLPSTLEDVGMGAFRYCKDLRSVQIPAGAELGEYMFYGCTSLCEISLPSDAKEIAKGMFAYCTSLKNIKLPQNLQEIGAYAFYGGGLTSLEVTSSLNYISEKAFANCTGLASITAKEGESIYAYVWEDAFDGCAMQFPVEWNSNKVPDEPIVPPNPGYTETDPTEPSSDLGISSTEPSAPQPPFVEPSTDSPTAEPTLPAYPPDETEPCTVPPTTASPSTQPPTATPTAAPTTASPTQPSATAGETTSDEAPSDDDFIIRDGFYIGGTEGFLDFEQECALSAKDVVANNKKELLELAWNVRTRGDVNSDNTVNVKDATAIQKYCAGMQTSAFVYKNADVNTDGKVNVKDATTVQKFVAGLVSI